MNFGWGQPSDYLSDVWDSRIVSERAIRSDERDVSYQRDKSPQAECPYFVRRHIVVNYIYLPKFLSSRNIDTAHL